MSGRVLALISGLCCMIGGILLLWPIGADVVPSPIRSDSLAASHSNDRATQVRILREYASRQFASDAEAQGWLNEQRIAARPTDWQPYTDELGKACLEGPAAVRAFADRLEGVR
jgi:hypothetical protein